VDKLIALIVHIFDIASCADGLEESDVLFGVLAFIPGAFILARACWAGYICSYTEVVLPTGRNTFLD